MKIGVPELMTRRHRVDEFDCGDEQLNSWLKQLALGNQLGRRRCTYVASDNESIVRGYYTLSAGNVSFPLDGGRRNMPDPVPVMVVVRLAVDLSVSVDLGVALLRDAVDRVDVISQHAGVRAMLVTALDDGVRQFYERHGFHPSAVIPEVLVLRVPTDTRQLRA